MLHSGDELPVFPASHSCLHIRAVQQRSRRDEHASPDFPFFIARIVA